MIVLPTSSTLLDYRETITLEGIDYIFHFRWSARADAWFLDLMDSDGAALFSGKKIVIGIPMFGQSRFSAVPAGELIFIDTTNRQVEPGPYELGGRVLPVYVGPGEVVY